MGRRESGVAVVMAGNANGKTGILPGGRATSPEQNKAWHEGRRVIIGKNKRPAEGSDFLPGEVSP